MITREAELLFSKILEAIGDALDPTETQIKEAKSRYKAIGNYLGSEDSPLATYKPEMKPQGSFSIGTMVKPVSEECELDFDLTLLLRGKPHDWTQYDLKKAVGDILKNNKDYKSMLEDPDRRRCWRIDYAGSTKFHLDILPCVTDMNLLTFEKSGAITQNDVDHFAVRITDNKNNNYRTERNHKFWPKSNPKGFAEWFKERMNLRFTEMKKSFSKTSGIEIENIPDYQIKTPLQRAVQILKRHRDIMFGSDEDRPISIIITTLSAQAYNQEEDIYDAIKNILEKMDSFVQRRFDPQSAKSTVWIPNPVNPEENFADKWEYKFIKEDNFYNWVKKAKEDINFLTTKPLNENYEILKSALGSRAINEAFRKSGYENVVNYSSTLPLVLNKSLLSAPHKKQPQWPMQLKNTVEISARYKHLGSWHTLTQKMRIPKHCELYFNASTNVSKPFEVFWQVVNTGEEARVKNGLRGNIFPSMTAGLGGLKQKENTEYEGTHWIECYIVKNEICVARSAEYFVNIA